MPIVDCYKQHTAENCNNIETRKSHLTPMRMIYSGAATAMTICSANQMKHSTGKFSVLLDCLLSCPILPQYILQPAAVIDQMQRHCILRGNRVTLFYRIDNRPM